MDAILDKISKSGYDSLNEKEKDYLFNYHLSVYSKIYKHLNNNEKKWLIKNL